MQASGLYPAISCCWPSDPSRTDFYYANGQFLCAVTKEPLVTIVKHEGYLLTFVKDNTPYFDDGDAEREDYDDFYYYNGNLVLKHLFQSTHI